MNRSIVGNAYFNRPGPDSPIRTKHGSGQALRLRRHCRKIRRYNHRSSAAGAIWRIYRVGPMATFCALVCGMETTRREFRNAPPLPGHLPLTVLTAETTAGLIPFGLRSEASAALARDWRDLQQQLARRSSRGMRRLVPDSDHLIADRQPHTVPAALLELIDRVKAPQ